MFCRLFEPIQGILNQFNDFWINLTDFEPFQRILNQINDFCVEAQQKCCDKKQGQDMFRFLSTWLTCWCNGNPRLYVYQSHKLMRIHGFGCYLKKKTATWDSNLLMRHAIFKTNHLYISKLKLRLRLRLSGWNEFGPYISWSTHKIQLISFNVDIFACRMVCCGNDSPFIAKSRIKTCINTKLTKSIE